MASIFTNLLYQLLPGICLLCDAPSHRALDLCTRCEAELPHLTSACSRCALPLAPTVAVAGVCGRCLTDPPPWTRAVIPFHYAFPVDRMITRFKFGGEIAHGELLARFLGNRVKDAYPSRMPDRIVPVPLHRERLRERGFNQAGIIAAAASRPFGLRVESGLCRRIRNTAAQSSLPARARKRNLRGAFSVVAEPVDGIHAIVDDVVTTGATAAELANALLASGVPEVHLWALARRSPQRQ